MTKIEVRRLYAGAPNPRHSLNFQKVMTGNMNSFRQRTRTTSASRGRRPPAKPAESSALTDSKRRAVSLFYLSYPLKTDSGYCWNPQTPLQTREDCSWYNRFHRSAQLSLTLVARNVNRILRSLVPYPRMTLVVANARLGCEFSRFAIMRPCVRPIERAMRAPRMGPQSTAFPAQPYRP